MRIFGPGFWVAAVAWACASGCATGGAAGDDDSLTNDSGVVAKDSGTKLPDSGGAPKDSGVTPKDSGAPPQDSGGGGNCGGQCLGIDSTCCSNTCVDITSDPNNCGGCGNPCGTESCCAGNCVDTMGSDNANCGGCGITCAGTCMNGQCQTGGGSCTIDMGTCSHSPCATGGPLQDGCDANDEDITDFVCLFFDPGCCTTAWDSTCVGYAALVEANACQGGGC